MLRIWIRDPLLFWLLVRNPGQFFPDLRYRINNQYFWELSNNVLNILCQLAHFSLPVRKKILIERETTCWREGGGERSQIIRRPQESLVLCKSFSIFLSPLSFILSITSYGTFSFLFNCNVRGMCSKIWRPFLLGMCLTRRRNPSECGSRNAKNPSGKI